MQTHAAIAFDDVSFSYESGRPVLSHLSFTVLPGELVALTGSNGSGKSTIAKLVDAMLAPTEGTVRVFGADAAKPENALAIRSSCGMVFQNPDDQLVSTLVHDEVAFGPRNLGLAAEEVRERVDGALRAVGLSEAHDADVNTLSGGQKQKVAIAGALAMRPKLLVLDEATSMLDPEATTEIATLIRRLHGEGITVLMISHEPEMVRLADRIIQISAEEDAPCGSWHVTPPRTRPDEPPAIECRNVTFSYAEGATPILDDLTLSIPNGGFTLITGPNGGGKSTLLKHMNGLLQATSGEVRILGRTLDSKEARNAARTSVGLAFQHPERQLFESTVYDDIAFGPRNLGCTEDEVEERVRAAMASVGLPFDDTYRRNPFMLSGGQQRKAAIAGILAMRTPILALDEPCAGLDARGRHELLELLCQLNAEGTTIVMVTHDPRDLRLEGCQLISLAPDA